MSEESLPDRLERLQAKHERGEQLTDEEIEQLNADMRELADGLSSVFEAFAGVYTPMLKGMNASLQPLATMANEIDLEAADG